MEQIKNDGSGEWPWRKRKGEAKTEEPQHEDNPKVSPDGHDNQIKDPADWVTGDEPMTGAQASYLKTLTEQTQRPDMFDANLSKSEASKRIDELKENRQGYS